MRISLPSDCRARRNLTFLYTDTPSRRNSSGAGLAGDISLVVAVSLVLLGLVIIGGLPEPSLDLEDNGDATGWPRFGGIESLLRRQCSPQYLRYRPMLI